MTGHREPRREAGASVAEQFGRAARAYATTGLFASGDDLDLIAREARLGPESVALDLACGAGHVALALAHHVRRVIGVDITPELLDEARRLAGERGVDNLDLAVGAADAIPVASGACDGVTCRYAAHHFPEMSRALGEVRRVLAPGGRAVFVDVVGPHDPLLAEWLLRIETLRDPSHVRDHSLGDWMAMLERVGFGVAASRTWSLPLEVDPWLRRMNAPAGSSAEVRRLFLDADEAARRYFRIRSDGALRFEFEVALIVAVPR